MYATRVLRQAAAHAERTPLIRFIGKRSIPENVDHTPQPHPASPSGALPSGFGSSGNSHTSFSSYRDHAQQHGPLRKTIGAAGGIGAQPAAHLGPIEPPKGIYFDRNQLPERFRRVPLTAAEIEAVETGGAALFG
ncbi:putative ribosomal protein ymr-31 protein [Daldinia childiae]|uniref:putative ribosomal protein ymr-31 protein n=1 Tax=Daldinia childiae TaxID=326645 RepID=UPI001444EC3F|nr:putative ribosomal protein ymr-31 protein [Daldinia childiae]KAF3071198.1 putative ribosomal protein ymr-31 protein [Daldinia childiae]